MHEIILVEQPGVLAKSVTVEVVGSNPIGDAAIDSA